MHSELSVSVDNGVARIRFMRPESKNALTRSVCGALREALGAAVLDASCRFVVLEGSGGAFASGADIAELERLRTDAPELLATYRELRATQEFVYGLDRVSIAAIDGYCMGAGLSLALACDLRIATADSVFAAPPAKLGLIYSDTEVRRLASHVGTSRARDLLFTGRRVPAEEALRLGLIDRLTAENDLESGLVELLGQLASSAQSSLRESKKQLLRLERAILDDARGDAAAEEAFFGGDAIEGMRAFLERRAARFS
jgi:enoyl-CoA hydratase/carnithine racemase